MSRIIVIGAGISGLAAAKDLQDRGFEVLILEAKGYVGGRIKTDIIEGKIYELGASWIHGDKNNPVASILKKEGCNLILTNWKNDVTYKNGNKIKYDGEKRLEDFYNILENEKENAEKDISIENVWEKFVKKNEDKYSKEEFKDLYHILVFNINAEIGTDMKNISVQEYDEDGEIDGGDKIVTGGYDKVINYLKKDLKIKTNTVVTKIENLEECVKVYTKDNEIYVADKVIVTIPLGVLKNDYVEFVPKLPEYKKKAINSLGMGNFHKTFLTFDNKFWDDVDVISVLDSIDNKWGNFINLEPVSGDPVLLVLHAGESARGIENKTNDEICIEVFRILKGIYPNAEKPKSIVSSKWALDPFTLGSYSYVPVGAKLSMCDDLAKPFGRIHFAGEHTTSEYPSTTHGAYLSGIRAAREIKENA